MTHSRAVDAIGGGYYRGTHRNELFNAYMTPYDNEQLEELLSEAETLLQDQKADEALALLDRARDMQPSHAWTMLYRGVALAQLGRDEEAVGQLIAAADQQQDDIDIQVDAARHLALLEYQQDALVCAERAIAMDETDAGAHAVRGEVLERLGRIEDAIPAREAALAIDPEDSDTRYYLAVDLCDLGRFQEAYEVAQPLFGEYADDADIVRLHGACLSYLGRHEEALGKWAELERLEGLVPNLLHNRASTLDALGHHEEALATINEAISLEPELAANYFTRGMIHERLGDGISAQQDYLEALTHDPQHLDAVVNLVELTAAIGTAPLVLFRVNKLLQDEPTSAKLLYARGRLLMELGEFVIGRESLEAAMRREPAMGIGWFTLCMIYVASGDYEQAVSASTRALHYFADDPVLWTNRGQALHVLKRFPEAMECYDRATQLTPDDYLPWLSMGRLLLLDLERPERAVGPLKESLRLAPENEHAAWLLALAYLRQAKYDEAWGLLTQMLEAHPDHLWGRLVRAAWYAQQCDREAALTDLEAITELGYDIHLFHREPLFAPLHDDPRYKALFTRADANAAPSM